MNNTEQLNLNTRNSTYLIQADEHGVLNHLYYGGSLGAYGGLNDLSYLMVHRDHGFSPNPDEAGPDRTYSLDTIAQEYPSFGSGDFRIPAFEIEREDGSHISQLRFRRINHYPIKQSPKGMPHFQGSYASSSVVLFDEINKLEVELFYTTYENLDLIVRFARIRNLSDRPVTIRKAASFALDFTVGELDWITFDGAHLHERGLNRTRIRPGVQLVDSIRGASSHQHNPFVILACPDCTETSGECYGFMLVYSGNFKIEAELDQFDSIRVVGGINDHQFGWVLEPSQSFDTPEAALIYSDHGFEGLSHKYHEAIRAHLLPQGWKGTPPVLINSWEAFYFDFDEKKLLELAKQAKALGMELFVLDDGWFKNRNDDLTSLGDWIPDPDKFKNGLKSFADQIHGLDMKFGLWIEPEMVSEDSDFYRAHPDFVMNHPDFAPVRSRNQLVLDFSRKEVRDAIMEQIAKVIDETKADYIKWDMNRHLSQVFSRNKNQGELFHRYVLGVYDFARELKNSFPELVIEGCSGGGGRFDAGMLFYTPQIWTSDNTDPIDRFFIQRGTSFGYPPETMGAHVSASPNEQNQRTSPLATRFGAAIGKAFGYELDLFKLSIDEKREIYKQVEAYKRLAAWIYDSTFYRYLDPGQKPFFIGEGYVSKDQRHALIVLAQLEAASNGPVKRIRLRGLNPHLPYRVSIGDRTLYLSGLVLMQAGLVLEQKRQYDTHFIELEAISPGMNMASLEL